MSVGTTIAVSVADALLYRGTAGATASTLVNTCQDVTLKLTFADVKANRRLSQFEGSVIGMIATEVEVTFVADSADAHLTAFKAAMIALTPMSLYITDKSGMIGPEADFYIFGFDDTQKLEDAVLNKFTLKRAATSRTPAVNWR